MYGCWSTDWSLKTPIDICFGMMGHFKLYIVFIIFIYITSVCLIQKSIFLKKENILVDFFLVLCIIDILLQYFNISTYQNEI